MIANYNTDISQLPKNKLIGLLIDQDGKQFQRRGFKSLLTDEIVVLSDNSIIGIRYSLENGKYCLQGNGFYAEIVGWTTLNN